MVSYQEAKRRMKNQNPNRTINKLCNILNIRFTKKMIFWPKGKRKTDGIWSKIWYKNVEQSNTFKKFLIWM